MKKTIKYAGIAAATLLAVAPVAAPVVSNVTTVKADSSDAQQDYQTVENKANDFKDLFNTNQKASVLAPDATTTTQFAGLSLGKQVDYTAFMGTQAAKTLSADATLAADSILSNSDREAKVTVTAKQVGGAAITDNGDLVKILNNNKLPEVQFTVLLNYKDFNGNDASRTATFTATKDNTADITSVKATYTTPLDVALNSQTTSAELTSSANVSIKDQDGNKLDFSDTNPTANYYYTYNAALNDAGTNTVNANGSTDVIKKNKFVKAGTYYQAITLTAGTNLAQFITDYENDPTSNPIYVNGKVASEGADFNIDTTKKTITFVRTVNVSSDASQWTYTKQSGIVTTKSTENYYTLVDNDNAIVGNRALGKNSSWLTDQYRTNQNGVKQYRVATGEWIDADNVTFSDKATTPSEDGSALTDIQDHNGTVTLDAPASFNYLLYSKDGKVSNRALGGDSAWKVIQTAKDSQGRTYYRVSTTEWVMEGNGVHFN